MSANEREELETRIRSTTWKLYLVLNVDGHARVVQVCPGSLCLCPLEVN